MALNVNISNGGRRAIAKIHQSSDEERGLLVFTKNRDEVDLQNKPFINETYGLDLAQDGSATISSTENVHNGIDTTYWTAAAISGTWTFDSTAQAHAGTRSIDATATVNNDTAQIDKGSTLDLSSYDELTGWIYITGWPTTGSLKDVEIEFLDSGASLIGSTVNLSSYIDTTSFNVWQKFVIPLTDMGVASSTIQYINIRTRDVGGGAAPDYYLDDIDIIGITGSTGLDYIIEPDAGSRYYLQTIKVFLADAYTATSSGQHAVAYDQLLGVSALTNGILVATVRQEEFDVTYTVSDVGDMIAFPQSRNFISGSDGTNTWVSVELSFSTPLVLSSKNRDSFLIRVRDDLSGLLKFTAIAEGYTVINEPESY